MQTCYASSWSTSNRFGPDHQLVARNIYFFSFLVIHHSSSSHCGFPHDITAQPFPEYLPKPLKFSRLLVEYRGKVYRVLFFFFPLFRVCRSWDSCQYITVGEPMNFHPSRVRADVEKFRVQKIWRIEVKIIDALSRRGKLFPPRGSKTKSKDFKDSTRGISTALLLFHVCCKMCVDVLFCNVLGREIALSRCDFVSFLPPCWQVWCGLND